MDEPLGPGMDGYQILLRESRIRTARLQASLAGNQEMILFYWGIDRRGGQAKNAVESAREIPVIGPV